MSVPDTLLADGTDLRSLAYLKIVGDMNLWAPGDRKGSDDPIPGRQGEMQAPGLVYAAYNFPISVRVYGANRGARNANLRALANLLKGSGSDGRVALTRHLANAADTGVDVWTAAGRFVSGFAFAMLNPLTGATQLMFRNSDGAWLNATTHVWEL